MRYVYLLQSEAFAGQRYVGITSDLSKRLAEHNAARVQTRAMEVGDLRRVL
jgi:putative endonuclease